MNILSSCILLWCLVAFATRFKYWYPQKGRQRATEKITKLALWSLFGTDAYFLWFPAQQRVDPHVDPVKDKEHHRINLTLFGFWTLKVEENNKTVRKEQGAFNYHKFRPDIQRHSAIFHKNCLVFSFGWVKTKNETGTSTR